MLNHHPVSVIPFKIHWKLNTPSWDNPKRRKLGQPYSRLVVSLESNSFFFAFRISISEMGPWHLYRQKLHNNKNFFIVVSSPSHVFCSKKNLNCKIIFQPPLIQSSLSRVCIPPQRHKNMKFVYVKPKNLLNFIAKDTMGSAFVSVCGLCFVSIFLSCL